MFPVMGRFRDRGRVRGYNIQFVQNKNHYAYGESPQRCVRLCECVCVCVRERERGGGGVAN